MKFKLLIKVRNLYSPPRTILMFCYKFSVLEKLENLIFEILIIPQTLLINN